MATSVTGRWEYGERLLSAKATYSDVFRLSLPRILNQLESPTRKSDALSIAARKSSEVSK